MPTIFPVEPKVRCTGPFLNGLDRQLVSIIPNVRKTTLAQIYGVTRKADILLVVEQT